MDSLLRNMDFLVKHWAPFERHFPSVFPVSSFNFIGQKDHWIKRHFHACDFSLILRGRGQFVRKGKTWPVEAPCVITQWPGEYLEYGPFVPEQTWDELYIVYAPELMPTFQQCGLVDPELPVWPIGDLAAVNTQLAELELLTQSPTPELIVDRVDRICERIVLETRLTPHAAEHDRTMHVLLAEVRRNLSKPVNFDEIAARHGMSLSTFRRRWMAAAKLPPARYLQQLRMREACRLLVESSFPIGKIANAVGFEDELYFSRRFRQETRMAPREYRRTYRIDRGALNPVAPGAR